MARVAVVGGGLGGLAAALFLARRGHSVVLIERDQGEPTRDADADFSHWRRPGVPQGRQPHLFLAAGRLALGREAPDALGALLEEGRGSRVHLLDDLGADVEPEPADADLWMLGIRRFTLEPLLRHVVDKEPGVTLLTGVGADGLLTHGSAGDVPQVVGVQTTTGEVIEADITVDAAGRRSALPLWLTKVDARPPIDEVQDLRFVYTTRWYQLPAGVSQPSARWLWVDLGYGKAFVGAADRGVVGCTFVLSVDDPLRAPLRDPGRFDRVAGELPPMRAWLEAGATAITDVLIMARIENRARRIVDERGPVISGLVLLGDAALHTNPTLGRGISLAFLHAEHLAEVMEQAAGDPLGFSLRFDAWTVANLRPWYDSQVQADGKQLARVEAALRGDDVPPDPGERLLSAARIDPVVARAFARFRLLLGSPQGLADPAVRERVRAAAESAGKPAESPLPRGQLERLLGVRQ